MADDDWVIRLARGRHQITREHSVTEQRVQLLDAMARAVAENGYADTTAEDVAARAHVPVDVFYDQFPDTESCFLAACDLGVEVLGSTVQDSIGSPERSPIARFDSLLVSYLDLLAAEPVFARVSMIEVYAAGPRALERRLDVIHRFSALLGEIFAPNGSDEGGLDPLTCEAVVGAISSMVTVRVAAGRYDRLPELREPILNLVEALLAGRYAASE
jgi:AcrR family transcriptional regulator